MVQVLRALLTAVLVVTLVAALPLPRAVAPCGSVGACGAPKGEAAPISCCAVAVEGDCSPSGTTVPEGAVPNTDCVCCFCGIGVLAEPPAQDLVSNGEREFVVAALSWRSLGHSPATPPPKFS